VVALWMIARVSKVCSLTRACRRTHWPRAWGWGSATRTHRLATTFSLPK